MSFFSFSGISYVFFICSKVISAGVEFFVTKLTNIGGDGPWVVMIGSSVDFVLDVSVFMKLYFETFRRTFV